MTSSRQHLCSHDQLIIFQTGHQSSSNLQLALNFPRDNGQQSSLMRRHPLHLHLHLHLHSLVMLRSPAYPSLQLLLNRLHPPRLTWLQARLPPAISRLPSLSPSISLAQRSSFHIEASPRSASGSASTTTTPDGRVLKPFLLADIGEGITGCEIVTWLVEPGQTVAEFDPIAEVQSDKATVEITSPYEGVVERLLGQVGEVVKVGEPLCMILVENEPDELEHAPAEDSMVASNGQTAAAAEPAQMPPRTEVHSTPAVRRLAREHQLDISAVKGTGKEGRVTKEDVLAHLATPEPRAAPAIEIRNTMPQRVAFGGVRQAMFKAMTQSLQIPHFGYSDQIDVTELERIRQSLAKAHPESRLSLFSLLVKILGQAMAEHALFRCSLSADEPPQFVQRTSSDISIALASPAGLLTPLIPSVEAKTVLDIAQHITKLRTFYAGCQPGKVPRLPEELGGNRTGTLTLSNIGIIGGTYTHPVIPPTGQLAIGAMGEVRAEPRYRPEHAQLAKELAVSGARPPPDGLQIEPRLIVELAFTADHRAVEGVELARLVECVKRYSERPGLLLGELV